MGGESKGLAALPYTETFYKHLPYYLAIGMSYELYWDGDCRLTESYRRADDIKRQITNHNLWLQGMYFYEALCDVSPLLHAFAKSGTKANPYPSEPYAITQQQVEEKESKKERLEFEKTKAQMAAWATKVNIQMEARAGKEVDNG